jgi:hypothetical protein
MMIQNGKQACYMRDKNGYLPVHVACSRHCSPQKLRMLLKVYPDSLYARTQKGEMPLDLALKKATKNHPNIALIDDLQKRMDASHYAVGAIADDAAGAAYSHGSQGHSTTTVTSTTMVGTSDGQQRHPHRKRKTEDPASLLLHFSRASTESQHDVPRKKRRRSIQKPMLYQSDDFEPIPLHDNYDGLHMATLVPSNIAEV